MKYRVIKKNNMYYPQRYSWFKWRYFYDYINLKVGIRFYDQHEAQDFLLDQTVYMKKKKQPEIVFQYEE